MNLSGLASMISHLQMEMALQHSLQEVITILQTEQTPWFLEFILAVQLQISMEQ